jgi:lysophospholipase L1-like esterase
MKISKSRIDYFLDKKDNEYNPNLDSFNLSAKGYNQAIKDVKKEIEKISEF